MADLLDIATLTASEVVRINGERIAVRGLHGNAVASIVSRFPDLKRLASGDFGNNIVPVLIELFGASIGSIIAAGCGHLGDEKYEQHANVNLLMEDQLKLLDAIIRLTFPNGFGSFVNRLSSLGAPGEGAKAVKVRLKKLPSVSPPSSDEASRPTMQ